MEIKEISVHELKDMRDKGIAHQLIDVREEYEIEIADLGGLRIPMGEIMDRAGEISKDQPVVIHCRSGARSMAAANALAQEFGFTNLINLKGGIIAWANEIDPQMSTY